GAPPSPRSCPTRRSSDLQEPGSIFERAGRWVRSQWDDEAYYDSLYAADSLYYSDYSYDYEADSSLYSEFEYEEDLFEEDDFEDRSEEHTSELQSRENLVC